MDIYDSIINGTYEPEEGEVFNPLAESKYSYNCLGGGIATVVVEGKWAKILNLFDKEEMSNDEKQTREHYRLYLTTRPEGMDQLIGHEPSPEVVICKMESYVEKLQKLDTLTERQLEVLSKRLTGMSHRAIAKAEGKDKRAIDDTVRQIQKKFSRDTPHSI